MSSRFDIQQTLLSGLSVLQRKPIGDHRGRFERMFCLEDLADVLGERNIVQVNRTLTTRKGTVRGMHFQKPPHSEMKFVSCLRGEVVDVAVDVRVDSPTRYQWHAEILSSDNHKMLAIPEGFAHGFQTLSDQAEMLYFHTSIYYPPAECGLNPFDPSFAIKWPLPVTEISKKDAAHPFVDSL